MSFPFFCHRTLAEVDELEKLEREAGRRRLFAWEARRLDSLLRREVENNPPRHEAEAVIS